MTWTDLLPLAAVYLASVLWRVFRPRPPVRETTGD